jgi:hypothetical protein
MPDNAVRNMKGGKWCSQLSTHFKRHMTLRKGDESLSLQTELDTFFKPALLRSKTSKTSESSIDE